PDLLDYAEQAGLTYAIGMPPNPKLDAAVALSRLHAEVTYERTGHPVRWFTSLPYQTRSWRRPRRVPAMLEHTRQGPKVRFGAPQGNARHRAAPPPQARRPRRPLGAAVVVSSRHRLAGAAALPHRPPPPAEAPRVALRSPPVPDRPIVSGSLRSAGAAPPKYSWALASACPRPTATHPAPRRPPQRVDLLPSPRPGRRQPSTARTS